MVLTSIAQFKRFAANLNRTTAAIELADPSVMIGSIPADVVSSGLHDACQCVVTMKDVPQWTLGNSRTRVETLATHRQVGLSGTAYAA
jgi:hypothetical protein